MHSTVYTNRTTILVIPPYGLDSVTFSRKKSLPIREDIRECIQHVLDEEGKRHRNAWWNRRPYRIAIRPADWGARGAYQYSVDPTD